LIFFALLVVLSDAPSKRLILSKSWIERLTADLKQIDADKFKIGKRVIAFLRKMRYDWVWGIGRSEAEGWGMGHGA
jgi:hypothetical protein